MRNSFMLLLMALSVVLSAGALAPAEAAGTRIAENHRKDTIDCGVAGTAEVAGDNNEIHFTGQCKSISVPGNENTVTVDAVESISVLGNSNVVTWGKALKGERPEISNLGTGNTIKSGSTRSETTSKSNPKSNPTSSSVEVRNSEGSKVKVESSNDADKSKVQVRSGDKKVEINTSESNTGSGSGEQVQVRTGDKNVEVKTSGGDTTVSTEKHGSTAEASTSGSTIAITEDNQKRTIDCSSGGKVSITGDEGEFTLKGNCAMLEVSGDENTIHAESVGVISVSGDDNHIFWKSGVNGKSPSISDTGDQNSVNQD